MPGIGGPISLTFGGFGGSALFVLVGLAAKSIEGGHSGSLGPASVYYVLSGLAAAAGVSGAFWWSSRATDREPHLEKLRPLYLQRNQLYWKIDIESGGASGSVEFAF
jgi:hypothetical protein